jgi:hypothetical protein
METKPCPVHELTMMAQTHQESVWSRICSVFGTVNYPYFTVDWVRATSWDVYSATKKIMSAAALVLVMTALSPMFSSSGVRPLTESAMEVKVENMQARLDRLDKVPEDLATIRAEILTMQIWQKESSDQMRMLIWAILATIAVKFLDLFGIKLIRKGN